MIRIAYCGFDLYANCLAALLERDDVRIIKIYSSEGRKKDGAGREIVRMAKEHGIPCQVKPISAKDVDWLFEKQSCDYILSACYSTKIPIGSRRGLNIHPTLLPVGRGAWPFPRIILDGFKESGVTLHKLTDRFDAGDIVCQRSFPIDEQETADTLLCKGQMLGPEVLNAWLENPEEMWDRAVPQGESEYWKQPAASDRVIDFHRTPDQINRMIRDYGREGVFIKTGKGYRLTNTVSCQAADHGYEPGTILHMNDSPASSSLCAAVTGGFLYATDTKATKKPRLIIRVKRKLRRMLRGAGKGQKRG